MNEPASAPSGTVNRTDEAAIKARFADELERVRVRSLGLTTDVLDVDELLAQHSRLMSPLVWDLAHVGNYEELWLLRAAAGIDPMRPEIDDIYDAFEHPRAERPDPAAAAPGRSPPYIDTGAVEGARLTRRRALRRSNPLAGQWFRLRHGRAARAPA